MGPLAKYNSVIEDSTSYSWMIPLLILILILTLPIMCLYLDLVLSFLIMYEALYCC